MRTVNKAVGIVFTEVEAVTLEARLVEGEEVSHVNNWGKNFLSFQAGGTVRQRLKVGACLEYWRGNKEDSSVIVSEQGESSQS